MLSRDSEGRYSQLLRPYARNPGEKYRQQSGTRKSQHLSSNKFGSRFVWTSSAIVATEFCMKRSLLVFLLILSALCGMRTEAQSVTQPETLFLTIKSLDAKLFEAYDHCDLTA
jgi:hypothetical protein